MMAPADDPRASISGGMATMFQREAGRLMLTRVTPQAVEELPGALLADGGRVGAVEEDALLGEGQRGARRGGANSTVVTETEISVPSASME